ncbi:MAG: AraC family transcriptional regulator [Clostridiales bacterium]|nr:AraC family transcriptional regulator [Clostridiales bacterium]
MAEHGIPDSLSRFNQAMSYIETHLEEEIAPRQIGRIAGCPAGLFSRIFSVLGGMPLGEYIRLRRLSRAALDLKHSQDRVIDLAVKYGYDSADAFTAAFKRFHGATPSQVRQGAGCQLLPPIHFSMQIKGGQYMDIRMEQKEGFKVAGLAMDAGSQSNFSGLWDDLFERYSDPQLEALGSGLSLGVCYGMKEDGGFRYMAGCDVRDVEKARGMGLEILDVPEAEYAVVPLKGPVPQCIKDGWHYVWDTFLPRQGYRHAGTPDFEVYAQGDLNSPDYEMELWVPVKKA